MSGTQKFTGQSRESLDVFRLIEVHSGISALIAESASFSQKEFDGFWISSLTESILRGVPDKEILGFETRMQLITEIKHVCKKPIIVDCDTGGTLEQLSYRTRSLQLIGAAAMVVEDKVFPKRNSFASEQQQLEHLDTFCQKIKAMVQIAQDQIAVVARCEALILGYDIECALQRTTAYVMAGADAIVIHSKSKDGLEIVQFLRRFKNLHKNIPIWCIPTTYNKMSDTELFSCGASVVIHANHLMRSAITAMRNTAESLLQNDKSETISEEIVPVSDLLALTERIWKKWYGTMPPIPEKQRKLACPSMDETLPS